MRSKIRFENQKKDQKRNLLRIRGTYFREPLYPPAAAPAVSARFLRLYPRIRCPSLLCKLPWRHVCARPAPMSLALPLLSPVIPDETSSVDHSILVHRLFFSFSHAMSHASMHYKYLQISRVPYSIDHGGRRTTVEDDTEVEVRGSNREDLLFGRCLRRLYGETVCVDTRSVPVTEWLSMHGSTTWPHDPMIFFLSTI